jgi:hypothetical protein
LFQREISYQLIYTGLMFGNVSPDRWCPYQLLDIFTATGVVFGHNPYELNGIIVAHFQKAAAGIVNFIAVSGHPFAAVLGQNMDHFDGFPRTGRVNIPVPASVKPKPVPGPGQTSDTGLY